MHATLGFRRSVVRYLAAAQVLVLAVALMGPASVAASTLGFTLGSPSVSSVQYSDLVTFSGTYTCVNDAVSACSTSATSQSATFSLRPSGGSTFTNVATVSTSLVFTNDPAGCETACSVPFQVVWRAGRAGAVTISPGAYDLRLTSTISGGELVSPSALTITSEDTTTTYTGSVSGLGGNPLLLGASVVDLDRGLSAGTGIITPDVNLGGASMVSFALYDSTNTSLVVGPVAATLTSGGVVAGSPTLTPPAAGGTFSMRTTYAGNGYYAGSSDLDVITIAPTNTPPALVVPGSPVVAEATSVAGAAVTYVVSASDAEDDPDPVPTCSQASGSTFALGDTTVSCSVTDSGAATTTDSFTVRVRDTTSPSVTVTTAEAASENGWFNAGANDAVPGVTVGVSDGDLVGVVSLTCTDNGVSLGALLPAGDSFVLGDGTHAVSCTATDAAGNSASAGATFQVDQTAPTVTGSMTPAAAGSGWWNAATGAPTVTWTCGDATSGVVSCAAASTFGEGAGQSATGTAVDAAGNVGTGHVAGVNVDLTAPAAVSFVGGPVDGGTYPFLFVPAAPTCAAQDGGSGVATCLVAGYGTELGSHTLTATATDLAGNAASATLTYSVATWTLVGFSKPIDMGGYNQVKAGNSTQLKFEVFAGSTELVSGDVVAGVDDVQVGCDTAPTTSGGPAPKKPHGSSSVDSVGGHLTVRWDSPSAPGSCWRVTVTTLDGSSLSALFKLK